MDPATVMAVANVAKGIFGSRDAKKAAKRQIGALDRAYDQFRDPEDIIAQQYSEGLYGDTAMDAILGREAELIPAFQQLSEQRARGLRGIQEESKLRQLGLLGQFGADIRDTLQDPRLAQIADADLLRAQQLTDEAANPLQGQRAIEAEQDALSIALRQGRILDPSAQAGVVLGRQKARSALEQEAAGARQRALQSAGAAAIDPFQFMFGNISPEQSEFIRAGLGAQVTDPGAAINIGSLADQRAAEQILGRSQIYEQGKSASNKILSDTFGNLMKAGSNMFAPNPGSANMTSFNQAAQSPMMRPQGLQFNTGMTNFSQPFIQGYGG